MAEGDVYECDTCGRPAPDFDDLNILEWWGGDMAYSGISDDPLIVDAVFPGVPR
jgi:hypothetical protein